MISLSNTPIQADSEENYIELWDDNSKECLSLNCFRRMPMRDPVSEDWNTGIAPSEAMCDEMMRDPEHFDLTDIYPRN